MNCLFKQKELKDVVIDVEIIAIGDGEHCISKAYDDYNFWNTITHLTLDEIEQRLNEDKLKRFHDPEWSVYKLREV